MFSQACVKNSVRVGACVAKGGLRGKGGMHGEGGVNGGGGGHAWQEKRPLQRTVRILLKCILVTSVN